MLLQDLSYYSKCPEPTCNKDYFREIGSRVLERLADHWSKDKLSYLPRQAV